MSTELYAKLAAPFGETQKLPKGGALLDYLAIEQVVTRLTEVLGADGWEFEVREHGHDGDIYWALGRLTAHFPDRTVVREQFGECQSNRGMQAGDARKGAASDAIKKTASLIGVGLYLAEKAGVPTGNGAADDPPPPELTCNECGKTLVTVRFRDGEWTPAQLMQASMKLCQRVLCYPHYREAKQLVADPAAAS